MGKWNLDLEGRDPVLLAEDLPGHGTAEVLLTRFDTEVSANASEDEKHLGSAEVFSRGVPTYQLAGKTVTSVSTTSCSPSTAWEGMACRVTGRSPLTIPSRQLGHVRMGGDHHRGPRGSNRTCCPRVCSECRGFEGPLMIIMGAGTNHYFHSDTRSTGRCWLLP